MADVENQNPPPNPQPHQTETLTILLALGTILFVVVVSQFDFVKTSSANVASCDCKLNNCPCLPPFYIFSVVATAALSVVWFGLFVLSTRFQYRFVIWVGLGLVWAIYWLLVSSNLAPQFYNPMLYSFNPVLAVLLLLNLRFRTVSDRAMHVLSDNWDYVNLVISDKWDRAIHVIANICVLFWNYVTGNF
ncbi:origin recognition complex subunit 6-like [Pyrus ussuriensis x Pyrus communis]|uniref:Origin recognition complex subunit 6-like n=1 Tax=Pyrus ussuriensis x Pyrus communis TaxID=2448454 RepID=A0A5N5HNP2_9ROSA|nr:origin recognition complex subunit 6-like [Pyrus ussuriensis x Pyrus communis]